MHGGEDVGGQVHEQLHELEDHGDGDAQVEGESASEGRDEVAGVPLWGGGGREGVNFTATWRDWAPIINW